MSILAAMVLSLQPPATTLSSPPEEGIVIVGERMRRMKLVTRTDRKSGVSRCVFKRRSGDAEFDNLMCATVLECAKTVTTRAQMEACMKPSLDAYSSQLMARREAIRTGQRQ